MYKLEIKLKQHTPLIHFQYEQEGATLRASEVKPKLDKYILTQLGDGDYEKGRAEAKANGWLVGKGDHPALDFKVSIESSKRVMELKRQNGFKMNPKTKEYILDNYGNKIPKYEVMPLFFGNTKTNEPKKMVMADEAITIKFFSFHNKLLNSISENINFFFFYNNFGTRQSKGFGSFYPLKADLPDIHNKNEYHIFNVDAKTQRDEWGVFYTLFQYIDLFYKTLRSGINQNGSYFKSMMYHYAKEKEEYWDKRAIRSHFELFTATINKNGREVKEEIFGNISEMKKNDLGERSDFRNDTDKGNSMMLSTTARLYRDMLGLSSTQDWMKYGATINKTIEGVDRYKSPLLIKPLYDEKVNKYRVYIIPQETDNDIKDKEVTISVEYKSKNNRNPEILRKRRLRNLSSGILSTPSVFSISDYLNYVFNGEGHIIAKEQIQNMVPGFIRNCLSIIYDIR